MTIASVNFNFIRSQSPTNTQDLTGKAMVIGRSSLGTVNTPVRFDQMSDTKVFGTGEGIEQVRAILATAGGEVYFTPAATTNPSVTSAVTKIYGNPNGIVLTSYGSVMIPGVDQNGDVLITAKDVGVSITVVDPGATYANTTVAVAGKAITITLKRSTMAITETGTGLVAAIAAVPAAVALISAVAEGTGASLAGILALTNLNDGAINMKALTPGILYRVLIGTGVTALSTTYTGGTITVNLATNAALEPTSTAAQVNTALIALAAANPNVFTSSLLGDGSKLLGARSVTPLQYGSTGSVVLTGTANDQFTGSFKITQGGTVGGAAPIISIWSVDNRFSYSSPAKGIVSPGGILTLMDAVLDTGLTATLTGSFDVGDEFTFTTSKPTTSTSDLLAAVDAAIAYTLFSWGYMTSAVSVDRAAATLIENRLAAAFQNRFIPALLNARDIAEGVPGETETAWMAALSTDFAGFIAAHGDESICAGSITWLSPYTQRLMTRPMVYFASARYSSIPIHEDLGKVNSDTSSLDNVFGCSHDESVHPGLDAQRFITTRTYTDNALAGRIFITGSITMADPQNVGFTKTQWVRMGLGTAYNTKTALNQFIKSKLRVITKQESASVPAGALSPISSEEVRSAVLTKMTLYLGSIKSDGESSAAAWDCDVPRNYNFAVTKNLIVNQTIIPDGVVDTITCNLSIEIPA